MSTCVLVLLLLLLGSVAAQADVNCDGVDDALTTTVTQNNFLTVSAYTIMGWLKVQSTAADEADGYNMSPLVSDTGGTVALGRLTNTTFAAAHSDTAIPEEYLATAASTTGWHHLAQRVGAGTITLFVDGVNVSSLGGVTNLEFLTYTLLLCKGITHVVGDRVAEVAFYNVAVPDGDIASIAGSRHSGLGRTAPTGYWPLRDCADGASANGIAFRDHSGLSHPATGDDGANNTGLTCRASELIRRPLWIQ
jgi:hypothetical protein